MKVAVIGCGTIANHAHIPAYLKNPETEILYFCDILPERADAAVKKYGCGTAVTDYRTILHDPDIQAAHPTNATAKLPVIFCARASMFCAKSPRA